MRPSAAGVPERVLDALRRDRRPLAVAESLTGGLLAARLVAVPGASAVLRGSVTAYQVEVKVGVLGVPRADVERHGVVSAPVALGMARGVRDLLGADVGVATTGVAGPGPSDGLAAGTVVVAVVAGRGADERTATRRVVLAGCRDGVRAATVDLALALLASLVGPDERSDRGREHARGRTR